MKKLRHARYAPWTDAQISEIIRMVRAGRSVTEIGAHFGATRHAIRIALNMRGYTVHGLRAGYVWTETQLAAMFGVHEAAVISWRRAGYLTASSIGASSYKLFARAEIEAFLRCRTGWPLWTPEQIDHQELRAYARFERIKAGGRWVTAQEVAARKNYSIKHGCWLARKGRLGTVTRAGGAWYVWEAA